MKPFRKLMEIFQQAFRRKQPQAHEIELPDTLLQALSARAANDHEDDFCQTEFLPLANLTYCAQEIQAVQAYAKEQQDPAGEGCAQRESSPSPLTELGITLKQLCRCLADVTDIVETGTTGHGASQEHCGQTVAFCTSPATIIYAKSDDAGMVSDMWAMWNPCDDEVKGRILTALAQLPSREALLLVDWAWGACLPLNDLAAVERYLDEKFSMPDIP